MNKTVLIVEDDEMVLECITMLLQERQLNVITANNGRDGVYLAHACVPDLIMSDLNMDGYDGFEVLQSIRKDPETARVPFVLITASVDREVHQKCSALGASRLLLKPFDPDTLLRTVSALLNASSRAEPVSIH